LQIGHFAFVPGGAIIAIGQLAIVQLCRTQTLEAMAAPETGSFSFFTSFMLQMGQSPGRSDVYAGCMGQ
jgi:hypothetical protein